MNTKLKRSVAKGTAAMAVGFVTLMGATDLLGSDRTDSFSAANMGTMTLASAQIDVLPAPAKTVPRLPGPALTPGKTLPPAVEMAAPTPPPADCTARLDATLLQGAMVRLSLTAPCDAATQVRFSHQGLSFDMRTDANGIVTVDVPALAPVALYEADLAGLPLRTIAAIAYFESYALVVLQ